ncbi:MAG: site-2 protease family protein [Clostridiales bacterium]|nr:site-2 protease family protein [Clostridiales bacterium]
MNKQNTKFFIPIVIGLLAVFFIFGGAGRGALTNKLLLLPGIIIGITFHEAAHGYVSHWLGDPTPKLQGRLSLNPLSHIDPMGFIALILVGFGWGKPVMIDPRYYKNPKRDELLVSLAGVTANLIIAVILAVIQVILIKNGFVYNGNTMWTTVSQMIIYAIFINLVLMCFNLLPVPPLDGFSVITQIFDLKKYSWYYPVYRNGFFILIALVFFGALDGFLDKSVSFFFYNLMSGIMKLI